ncbi:MAG: GSCFA domain-containing protein, partial [Muribaculaceae bacterium]|nr:GSCFA domain-containing protein [Muribaculaceae bacterium]
MEFTTKVQLNKPGFELSPQGQMLMMGSCFTDNIGARFRDAMWPVAVNPCGVQFNPASICRVLQRALSDCPMVETELVERDGLWHSWLFDSHFSSADKTEVLRNVNDALTQTRNALAQSSVIILTLGTSWVYRLVGTPDVVSNCHKFPSSEFERYRLTVDEVAAMLVQTIASIREINPEVRIIFTVSPIRHFKDGAHQNMLSKSTLLLAIDQVCQVVDRVDYFPAYEIVMDELRDYRFYAADMVHPSEVAIEYLWQRFREWCFSADANRATDEALR